MSIRVAEPPRSVDAARVSTGYYVSVWLHVVAAITWIGGMLFLAMVIVPMLRRPEMREKGSELLHLLATRFRPVAWGAIAVLLVTGVLNVLYRGYRLEHFMTGDVFSGRWGGMLAMKLMLVGTIVTMSVLHDFVIGPRALRLAREGVTGPRRERLRRAASWMGRVTLLLALLVVVLAMRLVRG